MSETVIEYVLRRLKDIHRRWTMRELRLGLRRHVTEPSARFWSSVPQRLDMSPRDG
jgi:hypothetical protein